MHNIHAVTPHATQQNLNEYNLMVFKIVCNDLYEYIKQTNSVAHSPRANYTD
jgi:hypothetical protein